MVFPERFSALPDYAFPRLRKLLDGHAPGGEPIAMTIGEPRHAFPDWHARRPARMSLAINFCSNVDLPIPVLPTIAM